MNFQKMCFVTAMTLLVSGPAAAALIDFEDVGSLPGGGLGDNDALTDQYEASDGVTFDGAFIEKSGEADANPQGFLNDQNSDYDQQFLASPGLGDWFVRTGGEVGSRGGNGVYLSILYSTAVNAASGQIWDIDGNNSQGTEQWDVRAYNGANLIDSMLSPVGSTNGAGSLDGLPWTFNLSGAAFNRIDFVFTGTKDSGVGLGFDNFNTSSVTVPEPGTLALLGLGLVGTFVARRRKA